ncbi:hypothetical protein CLU79DRAFT_747512 [Phycomyces nitens]|nr:hypothetical protein CLU79DRAFT_747512 [Phycomyces nitens]
MHQTFFQCHLLRSTVFCTLMMSPDRETLRRKLLQRCICWALWVLIYLPLVYPQLFGFILFLSIPFLITA